MSYDDSDNLEYNPFADEDDSSSSSNLAQAYYTSSIVPSPSPSSRPSLRRRRSSLSRRVSPFADGGSRKHTRSHTDIEIPPYSAGLHPLKTALAAVNGDGFEDLGMTRPYLSRILNDSNLGEDMFSDRDGFELSPPSPDQEKEVIMHKVTPKDSLAGVALKYGISLANLRRANKLWTSDTIHLRDVLYIPIDEASRAREYLPDPQSITLTPISKDTSSSDALEKLPSPTSLLSGDSILPSPPVSVRRISTKQLSYFPPSKYKNVPSNPMDGLSSPNLHTQTPGGSKLSQGSSRYSSSHINNSLSSILTALPIAASTRDELVTRLSFDSVSSSFSERSRANSDEENGHELAKIPGHRRSSPEGHQDDDMDGLLLPTPKALHPPSHLPITRTHTEPHSTSSLPGSSYLRSHSSTSTPRFYVSQPNETYVRTFQLEPSPEMQLPTRNENGTLAKEHITRSRLNGDKKGQV